LLREYLLRVYCVYFWAGIVLDAFFLRASPAIIPVLVQTCLSFSDEHVYRQTKIFLHLGEKKHKRARGEARGAMSFASQTLLGLGKVLWIGTGLGLEPRRGLVGSFRPTVAVSCENVFAVLCEKTRRPGNIYGKSRNICMFSGGVHGGPAKLLKTLAVSRGQQYAWPFKLFRL